MTTLSRYLLKEHGWPFALGFALILFILLIDVVLQTMDQVLSKGLTLLAALQLLLFNLAWIVALAVPMAVLIAVLMAFARLAADGEIIAAKACGVSFWSLLRPVLVAAFLLTLLMVLFNDQILPDWNHQARILSSSLQRTKAALVLREKEGVFIPNLGDYHLLIRQIDPETNELAGIALYDASRPGPPVILHAPRGRIALLGDGAYIRLELEEGHVQRVESSEEERFFYGTFARQVLHIKDERRRYEHRPSSYRSDRELDIAAMHRLVLERRREQERAYGRLDSIAARYLELHQSHFADSTANQLEREGETDGRSPEPTVAAHRSPRGADQRVFGRDSQEAIHPGRLLGFRAGRRSIGRADSPPRCRRLRRHQFVLLLDLLDVPHRRRGAGRPRLYSAAFGDVGAQFGLRPRRMGAVAGGRVRPRWPPRDERDLRCASSTSI